MMIFPIIFGLLSILFIMDKIIFVHMVEDANLSAKNKLYDLKLDILETIVDEEETFSNRNSMKLEYYNKLLNSLNEFSLTYILVYYWQIKKNTNKVEHFLINNQSIDILTEKIISQNLLIKILNYCFKNTFYNKIKPIVQKVVLFKIVLK